MTTRHALQHVLSMVLSLIAVILFLGIFTGLVGQEYLVDAWAIFALSYIFQPAPARCH